MSHIATIKLEVKDLDCLALACNRLGLELVRGQKEYNCWATGKTVAMIEALAKATGSQIQAEGVAIEDTCKCEHAIRNLATMGRETYRNYEIGLISNGKGGYSLIFDFDGQYEMTEKAGAGLSKLKQWYAAEVGAKHAKKQGWQNVKITTEANGSPKVSALIY